jgi:hypothetical protein
MRLPTTVIKDIKPITTMSTQASTPNFGTLASIDAIVELKPIAPLVVDIVLLARDRSLYTFGWMSRRLKLR